MKPFYNLRDANVNMETRIVPLDQTNSYTFDNTEQDGIIIGCLSMDFTGIPNNYKCITDIIDRVDICYYLGDDVITLITITSYDLLIMYDSIQGPKAEALKKILNFNTRCLVPLTFSHNMDSGGIYLSTPNDSPINYTIRIRPKIDIQIKFSYTQMTSESHQYEDYFVQGYIEYKEIDVSLLSDGIDKIVINPFLQIDFIGVIIDLGPDGSAVRDIDEIHECHFNYYNGIYAYKKMKPTEYFSIYSGSVMVNSRFIHIMHRVGLVVVLNKPLEFDKVRISYFKKRQLKFINGYLVDENGNKIERKMNDDDIIYDIENNTIKLSIEL